MIKNGIKVWMLSQEREELNVTNCEAMRLISYHANSYSIQIKGENERELNESIKNALN